MEFKSNYFNEHLNDACKDILTDSMREMIIELLANAIFVMSTDMAASVTVRTTELIVDTLKNSKFRYMPFRLVMEGFTRGSMGELGGTTKFTVRNAYIWMNTMYEKLALINTEQKTKEDAERRTYDERSFRKLQERSNLYGAALYRKMEWCAAGVVSSSEYDRLTLDKIVATIQKGYSIKELLPSMIL